MGPPRKEKEGERRELGVEKGKEMSAVEARDPNARLNFLTKNEWTMAMNYHIEVCSTQREQIYRSVNPFSWLPLVTSRRFMQPPKEREIYTEIG